MIRGLYTAAAGMISQQRKHDVLSNNIANANTPGFKQDQTVFRAFPDLLIERINDATAPFNAPQTVGHLNTGVFAEENLPQFLQGALMASDQPLDMALVDADGSASSFFTVRTPAGEERYTRNGRFTVDTNGQLVTSEGYLVLGADKQPIKARVTVDAQNNVYRQLDAKDIHIGADGLISAQSNGQSLQLGQLGIVKANDPRQMIREGQGVYRWAGSQPLTATAGTGTEVRQGFIERSNVDPVETSVQMMTALRAYEANQKVIQFYDKSLDKAVNEVGRV